MINGEASGVKALYGDGLRLYIRIRSSRVDQMVLEGRKNALAVQCIRKVEIIKQSGTHN